MNLDGGLASQVELIACETKFLYRWKYVPIFLKIKQNILWKILFYHEQLYFVASILLPRILVLLAKLF